MDYEKALQKQQAAKVLQSAGKVLSKTGEGAVVGVPMQIAGTILRNKKGKRALRSEKRAGGQVIGSILPRVSRGEISRDASVVNEAQKRAEKRNRVTASTTYLMVGTALFFDALQFILNFIPFVGWILSFIVGIFAWLTFYTWTSIKGWGWSDTLKKIAINWGIPLFEIFPVLNDLPLWTVRVAIQISIIKAEDALYNRTQGKIDIQNIVHFANKYGALRRAA